MDCREKERNRDGSRENHKLMFYCVKCDDAETIKSRVTETEESLSEVARWVQKTQALGTVLRM